MEKVEELTTELNRNERTKRTCRGVTEQELVYNRNKDHREGRRRSHLSYEWAGQLQNSKKTGSAGKLLVRDGDSRESKAEARRRWKKPVKKLEKAWIGCQLPHSLVQGHEPQSS